MGKTHRFGSSPLLDIVAGRATEVPRAVRASRVEWSAPWQFVATPEALRDGWQVARVLQAGTAKGDVVITDDRVGEAGVFALAQAMRSPVQRRQVIVVAGDSLTLERLWVAGTLDGDSTEEAVIDWELVLYRLASRVITPSKVAADLLHTAGIRSDAVTVDIAQPPPKSRREARRVRKIWLPEQQSRRAQTAKILRALAGSDPEIAVVVSPETALDHIWAGTTREANEHLFDLLGTRVTTSKRPPTDTDLVVVGDPFSLPTASARRLRDRGVAVAVPEGSTAASYWPEAYTWSSEDDLLGLVAEESPSTPREPVAGVAEALSAQSVRVDDRRAQRVSVGVPIFRNVDFIDECLESILAQTQAPDEVILMDDGSQSQHVDATLDRWADRHPGLIRVMRQHNRGVCVARNAMLDAMRGDAFLLVDADDVLTPTFIETTAAALRGSPDLWAVATWTEFFGGYEGVEAKPPFDERVGRRENPIVSTCVLVDMKVRDLGIRFDADLAFIYCEDWDFWSQILAHGGRFGLVPEPLAKHRVHAGSGGHLRTARAHRIGKARANARLGAVPRLGTARGRNGRQ